MSGCTMPASLSSLNERLRGEVGPKVLMVAMVPLGTPAATLLFRALRENLHCHKAPRLIIPWRRFNLFRARLPVRPTPTRSYWCAAQSYRKTLYGRLQA